MTVTSLIVVKLLLIHSGVRFISGPLLYLKQIFYQSRGTNCFRFCHKIRKSVNLFPLKMFEILPI